MEKPIDRVVRRLRPALMALGLMAFPVFMLSYGYMIKLFYQSVPVWIFVLMVVTHLMVWIGMSCLDDYRRERQN